MLLCGIILVYSKKCLKLSFLLGEFFMDNDMLRCQETLGDACIKIVYLIGKLKQKDLINEKEYFNQTHKKKEFLKSISQTC